MTGSCIDEPRQCVLVTGASRGIGAAIALSMAQQGFTVACVSRSGILPDFPGVPPWVSRQWIALKGDVTDASSMASIVQQLADAGWRIAGLVNNAGVHMETASAEMSLAQWQQVMDTNATAVVCACQAAYPHLVAGGA